MFLRPSTAAKCVRRRKIIKTHSFYRFHYPADSGVMHNINFFPTLLLLLTHYYYTCISQSHSQIWVFVAMYDKC